MSINQGRGRERQRETEERENLDGGGGSSLAPQVEEARGEALTQEESSAPGLQENQQILLLFPAPPPADVAHHTLQHTSIRYTSLPIKDLLDIHLYYTTRKISSVNMGAKYM